MIVEISVKTACVKKYYTSWILILGFDPIKKFKFVK